MTAKLIGFFTLFFFLVTSVCPVCPVWAAEQPADIEIVNGQLMPEKPVTAGSQAEFSIQEAENSVVKQAVANHSLSPASPLSPVDPTDPSHQEGSSHVIQASTESSEASILSEVSQAQGSFLTFNIEAANLPPETNFISPFSNGVFQAEFDDYLKSLLRELLPSDLTLGFQPIELVNVELAAIRQRIQEGLAGLYDFVVLFPTEAARRALINFNAVAPAGVQGFGVPEKNNIEGIGLSTDDPLVNRLNETFGPLFLELFSPFMQRVKNEGKLQGTAWIDLSAIAGSGFSTFGYKTYVLLQEMAHRWGTVLSSGGKTGNNPLGILGRDNSHWSAFFDAGTSPMDGLDWRDNGNGTFTLQSFFGIRLSDLFVNPTNPPQSNQFNDFDLYAMGLLSPQLVQSSFVIDNPTFNGGALSPESLLDLFSDIHFLLNPTISGARRNVSINDIINIEGARNPQAGSNEVQKNFSVAVVILKDQNENASSVQSIVSQVNSLASNLSSAWSNATRSLSTMTLGAISGAFNTYRNAVLGVFDSVVNAIQKGLDQNGKLTGPRRADDLNREQNRAQSNLVHMGELQNLLDSAEALLTPLVDASELLPDLKEALGNLPTEIANIKKTLKNLHTALEVALNDVNDPDAAIHSGKNQILEKVDQAESSGILPLGFGRFADSTLEGINQAYARVIQALGDASNAFEASRNGLNVSLNDALNRLHVISDVSPAQVRTKAVEFLSTLTTRQAALRVLEGETDHDLETLANDKTSLAERSTKVLEGMNQVTLGPRSDLETLLGKVNQLSLPNSEIMKAFSDTETFLSGLIQEVNSIVGDLDKLIGGSPQAPSLADSVRHLNEAKGKETHSDITGFVQGLIGKSQSEISDFQTSFRTLFLQFTGSIDELLSSFVASRQVSINNLAASRNQLSTVEPLLSKKHGDLTSQISGLLDPDVRGDFQNSLHSLGSELTTFKDLLIAKSKDIEGLASLFGQVAAQVPDFGSIKAWINTPALFNESLSVLESKISTLVNAKKLTEGSEAQLIDSNLNALNPSLAELTSKINQLQTELNALESDIAEAFQEQVEQEAQEKALNEGVDQLKALFHERENMMNLLFPDLLKRKNSIEVLLSELAPLIGGLAEFVPNVSGLARDSATLKGELENLQPSLLKVSSDFQAAEALLGGLEIARAELNQTHSLLSLRQAKDLLGTTQAVFQKTDTVTIFENEMIAHEAESGRIKDSLKTAFLVLAQERTQELKVFLSAHQTGIETLQARMNEAQTSLNTLRPEFGALQSEIETLEDLNIRAALLKKVDFASENLGQVEKLLLETQALVPKLFSSMVPVQNALTGVSDIAGEVRNGDLFSLSMLDELEAARFLVDTFPGNGVSDPFLDVPQFSDLAFSGFLALASESISQMNAFLHPPIIKVEPEPLTHFVIEALSAGRGFRESLRGAKTGFIPSVFGPIGFIETRTLEIPEEEKRKKEESAREYQKMMRRLLIIRDFLTKERAKPAPVKRKPSDLTAEVTNLKPPLAPNAKTQIEPTLSVESN